MSTGVALKSVKAAEDSRGLVVDYGIEHWQAGRGGTVLKLDLRLTRAFGKTKAELLDLQPEVDGTDAEATEVALDKLATWLERAAEAIRARGAPEIAVASYKGA